MELVAPQPQHGGIPPPIIEAPAPEPSDFQNTFCRVAFAALRYTALSVIAIASAYYLGQGFLGRIVIVLLAGGIAIGVGFYTVNSIQSITNGDVPLNDVARKADLIARILLWSLCVIGALSVGLAGGYFISGVSFLITGAQTGGFLSILNGLVDLTFTLGFAVPTAKFLMRQSNFLYEGYENLRSRLAQAIGDFSQNPVQDVGNILGRLGLFFGNNLNFDTLLDVAEHIPEETLRDQFVANLPALTDDQIREVINRFPNTFTIEFLAQRLPEQRFVDIVVPTLQSPLTLEQVEEINTDITLKIGQLAGLEDRLARGEDHSELQLAAEQISITISGYKNSIAALRNFIRRLPSNDLPNHLVCFQPIINSARDLENTTQEVHQRLHAEGDDSLSARLRHFLSRVAPQDQQDNKEDPNYEVLGALGFTIADFRTLGNRLGIPADELANNEIARVSQFLTEQGLNNRGQLHAHALINSNTKETILNQIVNYCMHVAPEIVPPIADAVVNEPIVAWQPESQSARVARLVNNIFHVALSGSLMAIQFAYQPVSTLAGFIYGLFKRDNSAGRLSRLWSASPDYINQGFTERMQELYRRISTVSWGIWLGPIGGVFAGLQHADAALYYGNLLYNRVSRLFA